LEAPGDLSLKLAAGAVDSSAGPGNGVGTVNKQLDLSDGLIEGRLESRQPGLMIGWIRMAGIIGDHKIKVTIKGIPVAIVGHGFVLANQDPVCLDMSELDVDSIEGELEEFRWSVDTGPLGPEEPAPSEESWLDLDQQWRPEEPELEPERAEMHSLYLKWQLASGETMMLEAAVSKVILLRLRRTG